MSRLLRGEGRKYDSISGVHEVNGTRFLNHRERQNNYFTGGPRNLAAELLTSSTLKQETALRGLLRLLAAGYLFSVLCTTLIIAGK